MPELPEVETVVRDLRPLVVGRTIQVVRHGSKTLRKPWQTEWSAAVAGLRIEGIRRRGKWIVVDLLAPAVERKRSKSRTAREGEAPAEPHSLHGSAGASPSRAAQASIQGEVPPAPRLIVHLGMTGQFTAVPVTDPTPDHLHVVFALDGGAELRFRDIRRFGSVTLHPDEAAVEAFFNHNGLGPEPFGLDPAYFRKAVRGTSRTLKAVLLDQGVVSGVGNIYADEACFRAGLHPQRRGKSLTSADADRLLESVEAVLTQAIDQRGSTIRDYIGGSGLRGGFQAEFRVYGRTGQPCPTCGEAIKCIRLSGRASHFCPSCQGSGKPRHTAHPRAGPS
jgi:formamidopyrimidine-DNA glycosylase